jgi:putative tricarboxylic transport membrane protein
LTASTTTAQRRWQIVIAAFVLLLALIFAIGARSFPEASGYAGIGPAFVPFIVAGFLALVGALLLYQALTGGFRRFEMATSDASPDRVGAIWLSAGILAMAALIRPLGFPIAAITLFVLVARAFGSRRSGRDVLIGAVLVFPIFWLFTLVLDVNLPRLVNDWI